MSDGDRYDLAMHAAALRTWPGAPRDDEPNGRNPMSYILRHIDALARCAVKLEGTTLTFQYRGDGEIIQHVFALNDPANQCRVDVDGLGVRWCVVTNQLGQAILLREDDPLSRIQLCPERFTVKPDGTKDWGHGAGYAHLRGMPAGACEVYLMQDGGVNVYNSVGAFLRRQEMAIASEGIHHIDADGRAVSEDEARGPAIRGGEFMWRIDGHNNRELGQIESPHMGFFRSGEMFELHPATPTQQSAYFGQTDNGELWFAVPGENTPEPWEFTLQRKAKPAPAPAPIPTPAPPPKAEEPPQPLPVEPKPEEPAPPKAEEPKPPTPTPTPAPQPDILDEVVDRLVDSLIERLRKRLRDRLGRAAL